MWTTQTSINLANYEDPPADLTESVGTESKGKGTAEPVMTNIRIC